MVSICLPLIRPMFGAFVLIVFIGTWNNYIAPQGIGADLIATMEGFTRDDVDAYAVESQKRAIAAITDADLMQTYAPPALPKRQRGREVQHAE